MAFEIKKSFNDLIKKFPKKSKKGTSKLTFIKNFKPLHLILGGIFALFLLVILVFSIGIYKFGWEDKNTLAVSSVIPFPAAKVNGGFIDYHDYLENFLSQKKYLKEFKKIDLNTEEGKKSLDEKRSDSLKTLVENRIIEAEAKRLKVEISKSELDESYNALIKSMGGEKAFSDTLLKYFDTTKEKYKESVYRNNLLKQKLINKYSSDDTLNAPARAKADEVLAKAKAGEDFAALAKQYSQDTTAQNGGDLGMFSKGKMPPAFEEVAFALKAGEISDIVKTDYGYHVIKVSEVSGDQIKAAHILIRTKDFYTWLEEAKKDAKTKYYIDVK